MSPEIQPKPRTSTEIQVWLVNYLANLLMLAPDEIDATVPFDRYGLDSFSAIALIGDLSTWLGTDIDPALLYDYSTVDALAQFLGARGND
jgi:acyl carrier protein